MFRGDLFVATAEINTQILDVCLCLHKKILKLSFYCFDHLVSLKMLKKNMMWSKANDAIIDQINLSQKLSFI